MTSIVETPRLIVRQANLSDAAFMLEFLNQDSFKNNIGDKQIRSLQEAENFLEQSYMVHYSTTQVAPYLIEEKSSGQAVGVCGLFQRPYLAHPDVGYGLMDAYCGKGYVTEALSALIGFAKHQLQIEQLLAIARTENEKSVNVLERQNFRFLAKVVVDKSDIPVGLYQLIL
ncbi:GNAT family N-acetyltransferase (plasmid) [Pseudoalteromonas sp. T1lg65]|uniref:GNAT family N-acetyltransferase n=1 Tax=Pseudoalteromonas sp. T1lg65 TaxID=2077101 RepID=UPI003F792A77